MKKLLLVYNPYSGDKTFHTRLDEIIEILQDKGKFNVIPYRMSRAVELSKFLSNFNVDEIDTVCISGGDGTINIVINEILKIGFLPKIGLFPSGTANDFCSSLNIPKNPIKNALTIAKGNLVDIDFGKINDRYFINVVCIGIFAEVSQGVDKDLKNTIGKLAYYIQGAKVLTNVRPMNIKITTSDATYIEKTFLILILNSDRAGGFKLAPLSEMNDGSFDLVLFKDESYQKSAATLLKVLNGSHVKDENVLYIQDSKFKIESLDKDTIIDTDNDGEKGAPLPLDIEVLNKKLRIYM